MKDEALKLALEALDIVKIHFTQNRHVNEAITAIKQALAAQPVQEPVDTLIQAWQYLDETHGHLSDIGDAEGRMHISVIRSAWEEMDSLVREIWDERGRP